MSNISARLLSILKHRGFTLFTGVPCSLLKGVIYLAERHPDIHYLAAVREDAAVGMASGAYLAGGKGVVFMQNSGLGVCLNALNSLNQIYDIPILLVVSWRGFEGKDAPEHRVMGQRMVDLLSLFDLEHRVLEPDHMDEQLAELDTLMSQARKPVSLIVKKNMLDEIP